MALMKNYELSKNVVISREIINSEFYQKPILDLSVQQKKLIFFLISKIEKEDTAFNDCIIKISDYCDLFKINISGGNNRKELKKSLEQIKKKQFWVKLEDGSEELISWLDRVNVSWKKGLITLRLGDSLKEYLLQLKKAYVKYQLGYTTRFKSKYSYDLYFLLKMNENFKQKHYYDIDRLKEIILHGDSDSYKKTTDFIKRCIEPAVSEINEFSDLNVDFSPYKEGRTITAVVFYSRKKNKKDLEKVNHWLLESAEKRSENILKFADETFKHDFEFDNLVKAEEEDFSSKFSERR